MGGHGGGGCDAEAIRYGGETEINVAERQRYNMAERQRYDMAERQ